MPRRLVTLGGASFRIAEYDLPALGPGDVRVRVTFAAPKHGTERHSLTGSAFDRKRWDPDLRLFLPREDATPPAPAERGMGNMVVGEVLEAGPEAPFGPGEAVFGYGPICEVHQAPAEKWRALGDLDPVAAVCADPAHVAFVAVRDGQIRIGDTVAVFGLGAIGLLAVQVARAGGAACVFAVDPLPLRRKFALAHGAAAALDPAAGDAALAIKQATGGAGVDVAIETSGNGAALHEAIRCLRQCGTVVHVPWGPHDCAALHLDEEFHLNRPTLIGSQAWAGWGNPDRDHPRWTHARAWEAAVELLRRGVLHTDGLVTPIVPFEAAPEALPAIFGDPARTIKIGVRFGR